MTAKSLKLELGSRSYEIVIGEGLIAGAGQYIKKLVKRQAIIITDENVAEVHLQALEKSLADAGIVFSSLIVGAGEKTKSFAELEKTAEKILALGIDRKTSLIALGGGVIGDFAGFLASILLRGIHFIQVPTTLLAMVDSSVGGKTGINSGSGKNLIGSFYQPRLVLADIAALSTLPGREFLSGFAEVIKYGLISDPEFYQWLKDNLDKILAKETAALSYAIHKSCTAKADIVARDEKEQDVRALLNLGHTFGHALELITGFSSALLHGEAVAIGMVLAFKFSAKLGHCGRKDAEEVARFIAETGLPSSLKNIKTKFNAAEMASHMLKDKKAEAGQITFILARAIGDCFIDSAVSHHDLIDFLRQEME